MKYSNGVAVDSRVFAGPIWWWIKRCISNSGCRCNSSSSNTVAVIEGEHLEVGIEIDVAPSAIVETEDMDSANQQ